MYTAIILNFRVIAKQYAGSLVPNICLKIMAINSAFKLKILQSNQVAYCLFDCLEKILRARKEEEDSQDLEKSLTQLGELLSYGNHYEKQVLAIASAQVHYSCILEPLSIKCILKLREIYKRSLNLSDCYEFIYYCCLAASKDINWNHPQCISVFT